MIRQSGKVNFNNENQTQIVSAVKMSDTFLKLVESSRNLVHHSQNRPLQLIAETAPSLDNLCQHLMICPRNLSQYLSQRLW